MQLVYLLVTRLPASLMTLHLVPYHIFVFYLYFVNNVANPFIYSFMNKNFRDQLQPIFCRRSAGASCQLSREQPVLARAVPDLARTADGDEIAARR